MLQWDTPIEIFILVAYLHLQLFIFSQAGRYGESNAWLTVSISKDTKDNTSLHAKRNCIQTDFKFMFTPAGFQDNPDVLQEDSTTELKLQTK